MDTNNMASSGDAEKQIPEWAPHGEFLLKTRKSGVLVKLPRFSEKLRECAKRLGARWDPGNKAWDFPARIGQDALGASLDAVAAEEQEQRRKEAENEEAIRLQLAAGGGFRFESPSMKVFMRNESAFALSFSFNQTLIDKVRGIPGARWNGEKREWQVPLGSFEHLKAFVAPLEAEQKNFKSRNERWVEQEGRDPLSEACRRPGLLAPTIAFDAEKSIYHVEFPCSLSEPVFEEFARPHLDRSGIFDASESYCADYPYPKIQAKGFKVEARMREALSKGLEAAAADWGGLPAAEKAVLTVEATKMTRLDRFKFGDAWIDEGKGFILTSWKRLPPKNQDSPGFVKYNVERIELPAERLKSMLRSSNGRLRCAWLSGFDAEAIGAYIESVELSEVAAKPAAPRRSPQSL